jgi:hypothetical protein
MLHRAADRRASSCLGKEGDAMRTIFVAVLVLLGLGLIGPSQMAAAPADGAAIARLSTGDTLLNEIRYVRRYGRSCYRKCYREFVIGPRVCRTFC